MTSLEKAAYGCLTIFFAIGSVAAYQITNQLEFGVVGGVFTALTLLKVLDFDLG